jgi:hypothetical protein
LLAKRRALARGVSEATAGDIIYTLMSPEVYGLLTADRNWSSERYERWLRETLSATLLRSQDPVTPVTSLRRTS